jgi:hypothetical protein
VSSPVLVIVLLLGFPTADFCLESRLAFVIADVKTPDSLKPRIIDCRIRKEKDMSVGERLKKIVSSNRR